MNEQLTHLLGPETSFPAQLIPLEDRFYFNKEIAGKKPKMKEWQTSGSNKITAVEKWEKQFPGCNWGMICGQPSKVLVIDIDTKHDGVANWKKFSRGKSLPDTTEVFTGSGGTHLYFQYPDFEVHKARLLPGVDIRGDGKQVVIPPSIHVSGNAYRWVHPPWVIPPAEMPDWLLAAITKDGDGDEYSPPGADVPEGKRNDSIYHTAKVMAEAGSSHNFILDYMMFWRDKNMPGFPDEEVVSAVASACKLAAEHRKKQDKRVSAVEMRRTDADNAEMFTSTYKNKIRYVHGMGWHVWNENIWVPDDDTAMITTLAVEMMVRIRGEALEEATAPGRHDAALARAAWADASLNSSRLKAIISLASMNEVIRLDVKELNAAPTIHYLSVEGGMVDLRTGEFLQANPKLNITYSTNVPYKPDAKCPFWLKTLRLALNNNEQLINYMQRAIGYSLTGSISEQCFFICWGESGNNGKSTIMETLHKLLGTYAQTIDMRVLLQVGNGDLNNRTQSSLARLPGTRMVAVSEAEENNWLSESYVKVATGGDGIEVCKKYQEPFTYIPQFKLWMRTNERPRIKSTTEPIWRRVKLIPFIHEIPLEQRMRRDDVDAKLQAEFPGILAWCVQGAIEWYKNGLQDPEDVKNAVAEYRGDMDVVKQFFTDCTVLDDKMSVGRIELFQIFNAWGKENGYKLYMTNKAFSCKVAKYVGNSEKIMTGGQFKWSGLGLNEYAKGLLMGAF
jgi:P4 family phage/plasmid primase-like protien